MKIKECTADCDERVGAVCMKYAKMILMDQQKNIPEDEERLIIATGRYLGEGFDDARLDTLFLALPIAWRGTVAQYAGRLHRNYDRKSEVIIYDYLDEQVPVLAGMFRKRKNAYKTIGYKVDQIFAYGYFVANSLLTSLFTFDLNFCS